MINKMMRFSIVKPLVLLAGLMLVFAIACGGDDDSAGSEVTEAPAKSAAPTVAPKKSVHEDDKKDDSKVSSAAATATVAAVKKSDPTATAAPVQNDRYGGSLQWGTAPNNNHVFFQQYTPGAGAAWAMMVGDPLMAYGKGSEWLPEKSMAESFEVSPTVKRLHSK